MKRSIKKRGLGVLLAAVMAASLVPAGISAFAEGDRADGDISLTFDSAADLDELYVNAADANGNGSAVVENGRLKLTKEKGWGQYALRFGYTSMQKFTASMDISLDTSAIVADNPATEDVNIGFATRLAKDAGWTAKDIDVTLSAAQPRPYIGKMVTRGDPSYSEYDSFNSDADYSDVNFTVIGDGTSVKAYLDGEQILENVKDGVPATTLNSGDIAILLYGTAGATFYVDNVSVKDEIVVPGTEPEEPEDPDTGDRADGNVELTFETAADLEEFRTDDADQNNNGSAVVENGKLKLTKEKGWGQYVLRLGYTGMEKFTASMDVTIAASDIATETDAEDVSIGFTTRLTKGTGWTTKNIDVSLSAALSRPYMVNLVSRGDGSPYDPFAAVQTDARYDTTVTFTVIGDGTSIRAYVNGLLMAENIKAGEDATTTTLKEGDIGLLFYGTAGVTAYVDNFSVLNEVKEPEIDIPSYDLKDSMELTFDSETETQDFVKNVRDGGAEGSLTVANGELRLAFEKGSSDEQFAAWRLAEAGEKFTLTLDVAMEKGLLGVFVRTGQDKPWGQQGVMLQDNVDSGGAFALVGYPAGTIYGGDVDGNVVYLGDTVKQYIQVKIIGDGNKITVLIGNEYAKTLENSEDGVIDPATPLTGEIGFLLYNPSGDAIAYFDNLKLVPEADYTPPEILGAIDDPDDKPDDKPGENPGDDNKDPEPTGCGGNVAAVSAVSAVTILSAACVVLLRKKKD